MISDILTPLLVEVDSVKYKLLYIRYDKDGSIYLLFPRKKGYSISKDRSIDYKQTADNTLEIKLTPNKISTESPYLSFHPGKNIIHLNDMGNKKIKNDGRILNFSEDSSFKVFPLCQLVIPRFDYFDINIKDKYEKPLVIKTKYANPPNASLHLEIWVHPIGMYIDPEDIPPKGTKRNIISVLRYSNQNLSQYACMLVISEIPKTTTGEKVEGMILFTTTEDWQYVFEFNPR